MLSSDVLALCKLYGPLIDAPPAVDGRKLMWAIAGCESSFGKNTTPRYEESYDLNGPNCRKEQLGLVLSWPRDGDGRSLAAFSYGIWQILPCNAPGYTLAELRDDPQKQAESFVARMNQVAIAKFHCQTLDEFAQFWNAGHWSANPTAGVERYVEDAVSNYQTYPEGA